MTASQGSIALLYAFSLLAGVRLGLFYDCLRITRIPMGARYSKEAFSLWERELPLIGRVRRGNEKKRLTAVMTVAEDFLFCVVSAVDMILLLYQRNNGAMRITALGMAAVGFGVYRLTLGRPLMRVSETVAYGFTVCWRYLLFFIVYPVRKCGTAIAFAFGRWRRKQREKIWKRARSRYTNELLSAPERTAELLMGAGSEKERRRERKCRSEKKPSA